MTQVSSPAPSPSQADERLRQLIALLPDPDYQTLRQYADLTLRGLHHDALTAPWTFIAQASGWPTRRRRQAAVRIAEAAMEIGAGVGSDVLPDTLWTELVEPTCNSGRKKTTWRYPTDCLR